MTVDEYLEGLSPERRDALQAVRSVILEHLPEGYEEMIDFGGITYAVPLSRYPDTYNGHPLPLAGLVSQKNYISLYLMNVYGDDETREWFEREWAATGKKLNMGKSCVRFKRLTDLPLELVGQTVARTPAEGYIARAKAARRGRR